MKADLHIHTVLSPCGDTEMTPSFIVSRAKEAGLGVIAITDHNSTRQAPVIRDLGEREGLFVVCGAEITTREEVHVLALLPDEGARVKLQEYIDSNLVRIPNRPEVFGYQVAVDEHENVIWEEESLLIGAIDRSVEDVQDFVHWLGGLFIPSHIGKMVNSLTSQLGYLPPSLRPDALELSEHCNMNALKVLIPELDDYTILRNSDAHYPYQLGSVYTELPMERADFDSLKKAIIKISS